MTSNHEQVQYEHANLLNFGISNPVGIDGFAYDDIICIKAILSNSSSALVSVVLKIAIEWHSRLARV